ncbi:transmembrane protease serine 9-like [Drosophila kikkawai]|uniref:Transmembrane protease serine 9-like n=1 Tax=Drosophila kikkawai TaxID=30033 RepID=A0ABM4GFL4_DROKI
MRCSSILIFISFVGLLLRKEALAQFLEPECGLSGMDIKIFGGVNATHGAFPWMAYLYFNENTFLCGGSLIHKRIVLTAAHCIRNTEYLSVRLGEHYTASRAASSTVYRVTLAIRNRLYSKTEHIHDIGLLRLDREVMFNAYIKPVCIITNPRTVPYVSTYTATGWGRTENSVISAVLQVVQLTDTDPNRCYEYMKLRLGPEQICAFNPTGDTCSGDSGGPLVQIVNIDGIWRYVQFGIVSYGMENCMSPGVYVRVHHYVDWILDKIQIALTYKEALAQFLEPQCGLSGVDDKVFGGVNATHGAFPWMAYLYFNENDFLCGGSLIHKRFVLTAAHCIRHTEYLSVRLGEHYTASRAESSTVYNVTLAIRNRLYRKAEHVHDIGLLRLNREVVFNAYIRPVCIITNPRRVPHVNTYTATGWGSTENSRISAVLQMVQLTDIDPNTCYDNMKLRLGPGQICAASPTGDTCSGDSGGPLVQNVNVDGTWRYVQFGIVSYGMQRCMGPGVYVRVHYYLDWILDKIQFALTYRG